MLKADKKRICFCAGIMELWNYGGYEVIEVMPFDTSML